MQMRHASARLWFQGGIQCLLVDKEILFSGSWDMTVMVRLHTDFRDVGGWGGQENPSLLISFFLQLCNNF